MKPIKKIIITAVICIAVGALAYFAWLLPFYQFTSNDFSTSIEKIMSAEYIKTLIPLFIIIGLSAAGIILVVILRRILAKTDKKNSHFAGVRTGRQTGNDKCGMWNVECGIKYKLIFQSVIFCTVFFNIYTESAAFFIYS